MAALTAATRDALDDNEFAVPGKRALPIHDEEHARLAWSQVDRTEDLTDEERSSARRRILAALRRFGVDVAGFAVREIAEAISPAISPDELYHDTRDVRVTLLREGLAASGRLFTPAALDDVARQAENLKAFADHPTKLEDQIRPARSVRDIVGFYRDATRVDGRVDATLHVLESAEWLWSLLRESVAMGQSDLVGLSIDSLCVLHPGTHEGRPVQVVAAVPVLKSCDVVTRASAGGRVQRILEGADQDQEEPMPTDEVADTKISTAADTASASALPASGTPAASTPAIAPDADVLRQVREALAGLEHQRSVMESARLLDQQLQSALLPTPIKEKMRRQFDGLSFTAPVLEAAIAEEIAALTELQTLGLLRPLVTGNGQARGQAGDTVGRQRALVIRAWERLFGVKEALEPDAQTIDGVRVPQWRSLREAYVQTTGDANISGRIFPELSIVREVNEVTTTVMNEVVLNSMTKRLVQDYMGQPQDWRRFCTLVDVADYKRQDRILLSDFAALSTVAEGGAYTNLAWQDARETYTPSKRGNLVVITREMILNDNIQAVRSVPTKLAIAAGITINEFVYTTLIAGNPVMGDGSKVYDDGVQTSHANRGTAALSSASLTGAISSMLKQTNSAAKRIGQRPRFLLVPPDLWATANVLVGSTLVPGSANNDINVLRGALEPIVVPQFTDATDYYLFTDPAVLPAIEIGFVLGQQVPELLLQDNPADGQVFTNDQISYKVRWEFGGGWVDYRGTFKGDVAG